MAVPNAHSDEVFMPSPSQISRGLLVHALTLTAFMAASSAPTPLYHLYQTAWGFSPTMLTTIFACYPLALLVALLFGGRMSDYWGRRPIITLSIGIECLSMVLFLSASSISFLIAARLLQGMATGLATASVCAMLLDLHKPKGAFINGFMTLVGMAVGALGSTSLVQLAPAPFHTVYIVLLMVFLCLAVATWITPETVKRRRGIIGSLLPRLRIPKTVRPAMSMAIPVNVAVWMVGGFYLSLLPSLIASVTHSTSVWLGGLSLALLTLSGGLVVLPMRKASAQVTLVTGGAMLAIGFALLLVGVDLAMTAVMLVGSVAAGIGFGLGFKGSVATILGAAAPAERASVTAVFYVISYLCNSLPSMAAGALSQAIGLSPTANIYGAIIIVVALFGISQTLRSSRRQQRCRA